MSIVTCKLNVVLLGMGTVLGWTSPAFDSMAQNSSVPQLQESAEDKSAKTWIGSSMTLGALVGALISGTFVVIFQNYKYIIVF